MSSPYGKERFTRLGVSSIYVMLAGMILTPFLVWRGIAGTHPAIWFPLGAFSALAAIAGMVGTVITTVVLALLLTPKSK